MYDNKQIKDLCISIAKSTADTYIKNGRTPKVKAGCIICDDSHFKGLRLIPDLYEKKTGVFINIYSKNKLRGGMGTINPTKDCTAEEIIKNTISAATQDIRFDPITPDELDTLSYEIFIIEEKCEQDSKDSAVYVCTGYRQGFSLPGEEGAVSYQDKLSVALKKGDISIEENPIIQFYKVTKIS